MGKIKRPQIAHFIDVGQSSQYSSATWKRIGLNVTDMSIDYGAQTETEQDIVSNSATTDVTGYQPTSAVSQQCTSGDDIFEFITTLRRNRAILGDAHSWMLNIDLWDESNGSYVAEVQEISIQIDTYGGAGGETPTQEFTINFIGDPIQGTCTISSGVPTFTAGVLSVSPSTVSVAVGSTSNVTVTGYTGTVSTSFSPTGKASATVSGGTVTVTGVASGSTTMTVSDTAGHTATVSVTVSA